MTNKRQQNQERVETHLRQTLDHTPPGQRLPSMRHLMAEAKVSQPVLERAIQVLSQEGLLEVRQNSGIYRTQRRHVMIDLLYFPPFQQQAMSREVFYYELISSMVMELAHHSMAVNVCVIPAEANLQEALLQKTLSDHSRLITVLIKWQDLAILDHFKQRKIQAVHVLPNFAEPLSPSIVADDEALIRLQLEYLTSLGHRRIAYLHRHQADNWHRAVHMRWDAFHRLALEYNLELQPDYLAYVGHNPTRIHQHIKNLIHLEKPPTALLLCNDTIVKDVYDTLRQHGREPGRDISVLGTNDRPWCDFVSPALTSVALDYQHGIKQLGPLLSGDLDENTVIHIPNQLVERESVVSLATQTTS